MKRSRKSNRVSWAPRSNLCQVKLFLSEDCPSKVGKKSQDHLQAKTSPMLPSSTNECDDDLPPGFEANHFLRQSNTELSNIPQIKWKCPPLFALSSHWLVAAGEESKEKDSQKLRDMRVLEAVYPRLSAIPPSPYVPFEVEKEDYDDNLTPLIPMIPIEEEESMEYITPDVAVPMLAETHTNLQSQNMPQHLQAVTSPINSQCKSSSTTDPSSISGKPSAGVSPCSEAVFAAASVVAAAIMKSNEQGNLLDMDLLLKIFNDPTMIGKLINQHSTAASTVNASNSLGIPTSALKPVASPAPLPASGPKQTTSSEPLWRTTFEKPTIQSVPMLTPTFDKPATPPVPLFRPLSGLSAATPTPMPHMLQRHTNQNIPHMSNGAASLLSAFSSELSTLPLPSASVNLHAATTNQVQSTSGTVKNANYYKNLIRQHGADKQDIPDSQIGNRYNNLQDLKSVHNIKPGEVMFKTQKPACIYFNSSRGCRNGSSCPYQHDMSAQLGAGDVLMSQSAKRVKLGPEIKRWI
ncbi:zinc finger CCCH domain-containing protein 6-like [Lotus japonicus]|uniref:zinc finger CCCH domain-containing protein 6-like n=1 Tax=Lotus japonicus TaxID=34305 RepID=UPI002589AC40|nr:zinc finger CCCH domain-containing protein 6-like [Lotus japonicus]